MSSVKCLGEEKPPAIGMLVVFLLKKYIYDLLLKISINQEAPQGNL